MRHHIPITAALMGAAATTAYGSPDATTDLFSAGLETRIDWQLNRRDSHTDNSQTGFMAKYLMLRIDGSIVPGLTYSARERFSKLLHDSSFWDSTDWIYLNYATGRWNFQAGKEVVAIGGWEYDRNPIDIFAPSVFWNNINCYELGVSASIEIAPANTLTLQVCQSPWFTPENRDLYGYNLLWTGGKGFWKTTWSLNLSEYSRGRYISYIALGNRFVFGPVTLDLDFMNRAARGQTIFFKDCSAMADLSWRINRRFKVSAKMTYDVNRTRNDADFTVAAGTEVTMGGAMAEYYPIQTGKHALRLHAGAWYSKGRNASHADLWQNKTLLVSAGITWNMNLFTK